MFYQKKNGALEPLTGSTLYAETPIGTVIASFLAVAPSGYIKADDTVYTKAQYPELYERIPDVFKDTVNETFTIDLREVALKGIGLSSLTTEHYSNTGLTLGEFIEDRLQNHVHSQSAVLKVTYGYGTSNRVPTTSGGNYNLPPFTGSASEVFSNQTSSILTSGTSARTGDTTEVKSVGVNYFVKAKHVALPIDIMDAISEIYATKEEVSNVLDWIYAGRIFANSGTVNVPKTAREISIAISNTGSTITTATVNLPTRSILASSSDERISAWTSVGGTAGTFTTSGDNIVVTVSTIASSYVRVWYR